MGVSEIGGAVIGREVGRLVGRDIGMELPDEVCMCLLSPVACGRWKRRVYLHSSTSTCLRYTGNDLLSSQHDL